MYENTKISNTGYWQSPDKLFHVRCEQLCDWIINYLGEDKTKQVYDFGCGNGQYLAKLYDAGFTNILGFEGKAPNYKDFIHIREQDLTVPFSLSVKGNCIFLEVAEHIPAQYENIMLDNITGACDDKIIMSWAVRGQGGLGHVNCLNNDEAIARFEKRGFIYCEKDTNSVRSSIPTDTPYPWFLNTTLVFKKA